MAKVTSFGQLRNAGSRSHNQELRWLDGRLKRIKGLRVRSDPYWVRSWQPTTPARKGPGMDLGRAGELRLPKPGGSTTRIPVAGAVPYARPTNNRGSGGPLVYLPPGQQITAENAAGKVVIRDFPEASIPAAGIQFLSLYITPDLATQTGAYARPYLAPLDQEMWNAGTAGAAGIVFVFDVPEKQVRGYWDPHNGTHYKVPGLFVGADQGAQLKALAAGRAVGAGRRTCTVEAGQDEKPDRNPARAEPTANRALDPHRRRHLGTGERGGGRAGPGSLPRRASQTVPPPHVPVRVRKRSPRIRPRRHRAVRAQARPGVRPGLGGIRVRPRAHGDSRDPARSGCGWIGAASRLHRAG